ncbi:MAG TPA: DUF1217 domain-containing protein [Acetobacteraceae bacterium]|nr:DUF1217 domain-containing protein [Acetobacteraceae bacterium]
MSGTLTLSSYLPSLFGVGSSTDSSNLLATLYGYAGQSAASSGQNPVTALLQAEQNETKSVATTAAQPAVARDVAAFRAGVANAKDAAALLSDPAVMKVLLTANGLGDQLQYTALAKKALLSNTSDPTALANQLTNTQWKATAQTYDFANQGLAVIQNPKVLDTLANAYAEVTWRQSLDATTPGLSDALTFRAQAASVTSVDQILGDPVLRRVVTTALGIPQQIAFQDLPAQENAISTRLDITQLQDPRFVEKFAQRYLVAAANSASSSSTTPDLMSLAVQARGLVV